MSHAREGDGYLPQEPGRSIMRGPAAGSFPRHGWVPIQE